MIDFPNGCLLCDRVLWQSATPGSVAVRNAGLCGSPQRRVLRQSATQGSATVRNAGLCGSPQRRALCCNSLSNNQNDHPGLIVISPASAFISFHKKFLGTELLNKSLPLAVGRSNNIGLIKSQWYVSQL